MADLLGAFLGDLHGEFSHQRVQFPCKKKKEEDFGFDPLQDEEVVVEEGKQEEDTEKDTRRRERREQDNDEEDRKKKEKKGNNETNKVSKEKNGIAPMVTGGRPFPENIASCSDCRSSASSPSRNE